MIRTSVALLDSDWQSVRAALLTPDGCENAGVLLCGNSQLHNERRLLVREFISVPAERYIERQSYHLEVAPSFYNDIVTRCLKQALTPIIVHSHPFHGEAIYSSSDDYGEERLLHTLNTLLPETPP